MTLHVTSRIDVRLYLFIEVFCLLFGYIFTIITKIRTYIILTPFEDSNSWPESSWLFKRHTKVTPRRILDILSHKLPRLQLTSSSRSVSKINDRPPRYCTRSFGVKPLRGGSEACLGEKLRGFTRVSNTLRAKYELYYVASSFSLLPVWSSRVIGSSVLEGLHVSSLREGNAVYTFVMKGPRLTNSLYDCEVLSPRDSKAL